ncbi:MAG: hypothetical protein WC851_02650 [Candidatus Shapirobacteria bacterium]|jgi:hypothetical protein
MSERIPGLENLNTLSQNQRIYAAATSVDTPIELRAAIARTYQSKRVDLNSL